MSIASRSVRAAAAAVLIALTGSACAARPPLYRYPARTAVDNRAYDIGYRQGRIDGEEDARRGRRADATRHRDFRNADDGYRGGNRNAYRQLYRQGFVTGYDEAHNRYARGGVYRGGPSYPPYTYPPYPGGSGRQSPAAQNGFRDGFEQGRADARDGDRYEPVRARAYRDGDRGYDRRYGSADAYKRDYRAAFQHGYERGYRAAR